MRTSSGREEKPVTDPSHCRSCRAEVLWVEWASGKRMPVDATPDNRPLPKGGDIVLAVRGGLFGKLVAEKFDTNAHGFARNRYTSHFATCPNANEHRRGR